MKRVVCFVYLAFQASNLFSADQFEHRRFFLQFQKVTGLPSEILHHIATFIAFDDRETDEEFVARAAALKTIKQEHKEKTVDLEMPGHIIFNQKEARLSYAIDGKKIYRFREVTSVGAHGDSRDMKTAHLVSIRLEPLFPLVVQLPPWNSFFAFSPQVQCFALSRDEKVCAQLIQTKNPDEQAVPHLMQRNDMVYQLRYKWSESEGERQIVVTKNYSLFQSIAFNKQGTKIIMFAVHNAEPDGALKCVDGTFYHIFPIHGGPEAEKQNQKTLLGYLKQLIAKSPNN